MWLEIIPVAIPLFLFFPHLSKDNPQVSSAGRFLLFLPSTNIKKKKKKKEALLKTQHAKLTKHATLMKADRRESHYQLMFHVGTGQVVELCKIHHP